MLWRWSRALIAAGSDAGRLRRRLAGHKCEMSGDSPREELEALASVRDLRVAAAVSSGLRDLGCEASSAAADMGGFAPTESPLAAYFRIRTYTVHSRPKATVLGHI